MRSPLYSLRQFHKVLRHLLDGVEKTARETDYTDAQQVQALTGQFQMVSQLLAEHIQSEDAVFFPPLEAKIANVIPNYHMDHRADEKLLGEISELLTRLQESSQADSRAALGDDIYRQVVALNSTSAHHMDKEEEIVVPLMVEHLSEHEQWALLERTFELIPVEAIGQMTPMFMSLLTQGEREEQIRTEMRAMKPEMFRAVVASAPRGMSPEEWQDLVKRIPELSNISS